MLHDGALPPGTGGRVDPWIIEGDAPPPVAIVASILQHLLPLLLFLLLALVWLLVVLDYVQGGLHPVPVGLL